MASCAQRLRILPAGSCAHGWDVVGARLTASCDGCGLLIVLLLTEGVQFFLECRVASFADIALGALGIVLSITLGTWIKDGSSSIRVKGIARKRL
jgi:hypothetical protein